VKLSSDTLALLSLLQTDAFDPDGEIILWEDCISAVLNLGRLSHQTGERVMREVQKEIHKLAEGMPVDKFLVLCGMASKPQVVKGIMPNGDQVTQRFADDWGDICKSPVDVNEGRYPPNHWPVWFDGERCVTVWTNDDLTEVKIKAFKGRG
jgi:hypothetical protein